MVNPDDWLVCDDDDAALSWELPRPLCSIALSIVRCLAAAAMVVTASRTPVSEPVEDCELALRGITGLRLEAAVEATILLVGFALFPLLAGDGIGGGRISTRGNAAVGTVGAGTGAAFATGVTKAGVVAASGISSRFAGDGRGGGGISDAVIAVLPEDTSPSLISSSSEPGGETNRAVGRGPDAEGPRDFFSIGWGGGGLEDDGVGDLTPPFDELELCPWLIWTDSELSMSSPC